MNENNLYHTETKAKISLESEEIISHIPNPIENSWNILEQEVQSQNTRNKQILKEIKRGIGNRMVLIV